MNNCFIILAAGQSKRFKSVKLKQYTNYKNRPIFEHSLDKIIESKLFKHLILVTNKKISIKKKYSKKVKIIKGGKERSDSSLIALKFIKRYKPKNVLIHDAARPDFTIKLLKNLILQLKNNKAVIPFIYSKDSVKYKIKNNFYNLDRKKTFLTQTPQAFKFKEIYNLSINKKKNITDDSALFFENNSKVKFIRGENKNNKITYIDDLKLAPTYYGIGFDIHRLVKNKVLYLGGIEIPFHSGLKGHSDGDVILHAIIDAILGATRNKDIGTYFPNTKKFKNIKSPKMLKPIITDLYKSNFHINNLDINLICEQPKVSKIRSKVINSLSKLMKLNTNKINLKGKTVEKLGLIGKQKAIACEVIISITKYD